MNFTDIAYIYVLAFGMIAGIGLTSLAWLVCAWREDRKEGRSHGA